MIRDQQRQRVYNWDATLRGKAITLDECRLLIDKVCLAYGIRTPRVKDGRGTRVARGGFSLISLPIWARCVGVVLHEVTHTILANRCSKVAPHGPEFARLMAELVVRFGGQPRKNVVANARVHRVKLAAKNKVPEPVIQVRAAARFKNG